MPRVLLDLAPSLEPADLTRACHEAWVHHRVTPQMIEACIARNPTKPGAAKLRHAYGADVTLSKLEDVFLELLEAHDLPLPRTNIDVSADKVDCHWEEHGLTIELQSYGFHGTATLTRTTSAAPALEPRRVLLRRRRRPRPHHGRRGAQLLDESKAA